MALSLLDISFTEKLDTDEEGDGESSEENVSDGEYEADDGENLLQGRSKSLGFFDIAAGWRI